MSPTRSKKHKQRHYEKRKQLEIFKRKLERGPCGDKITITPGGEVKMSEVLRDFVEPYRSAARTEDAYRKLLTVALIAWDVSLLPEAEQQGIIDQIVDAGITGGNDKLKADMKGTVNMLLARKKACFAQYTQRIIDFQLTDTDTGYHLAVASMPGRPPS